MAGSDARVGSPGAGMRRYGPLTSALSALAMALFVLPSALNVPQSNPTQTLEFAPVPPEDDDPPPPETANLESLSLGQSSTAPAGDAPGGDGPGLPPPPELPDGQGLRPVSKRCVGNPPRQTEDKMSPPCVAHFEGDNGGETYEGVTGEEIRLVLYLHCVITTGDNGSEDNCNSGVQGTIQDLWVPPDGNEHVDVRNLRRFQNYFNDRYQTYGRRVHFFVHYATTQNSDTTNETRVADAAYAWDQVRPFAVTTTGATGGFETAYAGFMADKGALVFGSASGSQSDDFYLRYAPQIWSYAPSIESRARMFSNYVCNHVVPFPVADTGNAADMGVERKLGFLHTTDPAHPELLMSAELVRDQVEACGGVFEEVATFPQADVVGQQQGDDPSASYATPNMARFQQAGITTIIWPGGYETDQSKAADRLGYYPEIVAAGDGLLESQVNARQQTQAFWDHSWAISPVTLVPENELDDPCRQALHEGDPGLSDATLDDSRGCGAPWYQDLRQLFTGIQVAGPKLTPESMDKGFHAIPAVASTDPLVPACYYLPGDYTCVKDSVVMHWDSGNGAESYANDGCYRMVLDGQRFIADGWPSGNIDEHATPDDVCNTYSRAANLL